MKIEVPFSPAHNTVKIVLTSPVNGESSYEVESSATHVEINDKEWAAAEEVKAHFCGPSGEPDPAVEPVTLKARHEYQPPQDESPADLTTSPGVSSGDGEHSDEHVSADEGRDAEPVSEAPAASADAEAKDGSGDEAPSVVTAGVDVTAAGVTGSSNDLSDEELEALTKPADPPVADHLRD